VEDQELCIRKPKTLLPTVYFLWEAHLTPDQVVRVQDLTGNIVCIVFMGKTLHSHSASLHPGV